MCCHLWQSYVVNYNDLTRSGVLTSHLHTLEYKVQVSLHLVKDQSLQIIIQSSQSKGREKIIETYVSNLSFTRNIQLCTL